MKKILLLMLIISFCGCQGRNEDITEYKTEYENEVKADDTKNLEQNISDIINQMTIDEKIGQLFIVVPECLDTDGGACVYFTDTIKENINKYNAGGVVFFSQNIISGQQISELLSSMQEAAKYDMFMCVDEEGGDVTRIAGNENIDVEIFPPMSQISDENDAYNVGDTIGKYISELGFNVDFAPVCDVLTNKENAEIGSRAFSDNPEIVSLMSGEVIRGLKNNNICTAAKHFPGHGNASANSHNGYSQTLKKYDEMKECEFIPFENAIKNDTDFVLVSHISAPELTGSNKPCSLSKEIYEILRNDLKFDGIAVTDALNMGAVTEYYSENECLEAFLAGADMLLMPQDIDSSIQKIKSAVESGEISEERINESLERILAVKIQKGIM